MSVPQQPAPDAVGLAVGENSGVEGPSPVARMRYYHIHLRVGGGDITGDGIYQCVLSYMGSGLAEGAGSLLCYTDRIQGVINVEEIRMDPPAVASFDVTPGPYKSQCLYSINGPNPLYIRGEIRARYAISKTQGLLGLHIPYETDEATFVVDMSGSAIKLPLNAEAQVFDGNRMSGGLTRPTLECSNGSVWFVSAHGLSANSSLVVQWGLNKSGGASREQVRDRVFIGYSNQDSDWLIRVKTMLHPLIRKYTLSVWDDTCVQPGQNRLSEIEAALKGTKVAVLLVSPYYIATEFGSNELPPVLRVAQNEGVQVLWIPLKPSLVSHTPIAAFEPAYDPETPLSVLTEPEQDRALVEICTKIVTVAQS